MTDKIIFLSTLNKTLKQIEQEIIDRVIVCLKIGESKLKTKDVFTTDFEVEIEVTYYLDNEDNPSHLYSTRFSYQRTVIEKDYGMLLDNGNGTDRHRTGSMLLLDESYCYLLHDLIDHSHIGNKIYKIERIWIDVIYSDQKGIKINEDGSWRMLVNDDEGGFV